jgi:hypothetical protein
MAVTFGFYNSANGDRTYNATQMSSIFDGIIRDGVLAAVGNSFQVSATGIGMTIKVGSGRAWFDHTWTYNDSELPLNVKQSDTVLDRIDALVIEVDTRDESRTNSIRFVFGTPSSVPVRPALIKEEYIKQYPLAYIYVAHGATIILQGNITNMIGTSETPFVTAPLETISADALLAEWSDQWRQLFGAMDSEKTEQEADWADQLQAMQAQWGLWIGGAVSDPSNYFQRNFDNPAMYIGSTRWKTKAGPGVVLEEIRSGQTASGALAASRTTTQRTNGADIEYVFYDLQNGTVIGHFIEHNDKVSTSQVKNWVEASS